MTAPIYTSENCVAAYQLRWSLALFASAPLPSSDTWLETLRTVVERDSVRLLEHHTSPPNTHFFLLSTPPKVALPQIVKSVKGRLQNAIQDQVPQAFRRNFRLTSVGDTNRETVEAYVADQLGHHRMADDRVQQVFSEFQFEFPEVDLSAPVRSAHAEYAYNLHLVLVHAERWCEIRRERLQKTANMIRSAASAKRDQLSRLSVLADHLHVTLRPHYERSPQEVALSYMNNIAFAHGMNKMFSFSFYVGTFGEYDMSAIRAAQSPSSLEPAS